ncbi:hypothetical protein J4407_00530 [Candidatus Pacearchaeota archaeon]|nr:hypothetical protein [Candidatus Pacearchaeota archaeon]
MVLVERFEKNGKEIIFIGVSHSTDLFQIDLIRSKLEKMRPDVILIEGGYENAEFLSEDDAISRGWEMGFVSYFAKKKKILLLPNDPSEKECIKFIENIYGKDLAFLYFFLRNLDSLLRKDLPLSSEEKMKIVLKEFEENSQWENYDYTSSNFKRIFLETFDKDFILDNIYGNYFNSSLNYNITNEATRKINTFRDKFMAEQIIKYLKSHNRIFIIKGKTHLFDNKELFQKLFT